MAPHGGSIRDDAQSSACLRMLYVEDNRLNALLFEEAVHALSHSVELRIAEDCGEALALVQGWQPHVLVLDAHLPDASGYDVLVRLRAAPGLGNVPAYMCSADDLPEDIERARAAGFVGYWVKPVHRAQVMAAIEAWMPH